MPYLSKNIVTTCSEQKKKKMPLCFRNVLNTCTCLLRNYSPQITFVFHKTPVFFSVHSVSPIFSQAQRLPLASGKAGPSPDHIPPQSPPFSSRGCLAFTPLPNCGCHLEAMEEVSLTEVLRHAE